MTSRSRCGRSGTAPWWCAGSRRRRRERASGRSTAGRPVGIALETEGRSKQPVRLPRRREVVVDELRLVIRVRRRRACRVADREVRPSTSTVSPLTRRCDPMRGAHPRRPAALLHSRKRAMTSGSASAQLRARSRRHLEMPVGGVAETTTSRCSRSSARCCVGRLEVEIGVDRPFSP